MKCLIAGERVHLRLLQGGNMAYGSAGKNLKKRRSENLDRPLSTGIRDNPFPCGLSKSRLKLYSFQAEAGTYTVSLNDEVRIRDKACAFLVNAVTKRPVDYSLFSVQVYRHTSGMVLSLCILGIIFGAVIMVSGAILPAVL